MAEKKFFGGRPFTFLLSLWRYLATCFASSVLPAVKKRQSMNACSLWYRIEWLTWLCSDRHFPKGLSAIPHIICSFQKEELETLAESWAKFTLNEQKHSRHSNQGFVKVDEAQKTHVLERFWSDYARMRIWQKEPRRIDSCLRKLADLLNLSDTSDKLGVILLQQQSPQW